jgi:hypothetical protein
VFDSVPIHVRFVVDVVSLRHGVLRVSQFSVVSIIPPLFYTHIRPNTAHKKDNGASLITNKESRVVANKREQWIRKNFYVVLRLLAENLFYWQPSLWSRYD